MKFAAAAFAQKKTLRQLLHGKMTVYEPGRDYDRIHASQLTRPDPEFCAREWALAGKHGLKPKGETVPTCSRMTFDIGWMIQEYVTDRFAELGMAIGTWKCKSCGQLHEFCTRPVVCQGSHCASKAFDYVESVAVSKEAGHSGSLDLLLRIDASLKLLFVEIKSIDKEKIKELKAPLAEHKLRTELYLRTIADAEDDMIRNTIRTDYAKVLYVSKGGWGVQTIEPKMWNQADFGYSPFVEFDVERNDPATDEYWANSKAVKMFRDGKTNLPPRICPNSTCKRAKLCTAVFPCFTGEPT